MYITSFGNSFIKLNIKSPNLGDSVLFIDPFATKTWGMRQPKMESDIILLTEPENIKGLTLPREAKVISEPGEYETKEIYILGRKSDTNKEKRQINYFLIEAEGMTLVHLGATKQTNFSDQDADAFGNVDILFIPVGGNDSLTGKQAANLVKQLEPRLIIPIHYKFSGSKTNLADEKEFLKEMGTPKTEVTSKYSIKKKDLPSDDTKIILIHP